MREAIDGMFFVLNSRWSNPRRNRYRRAGVDETLSDEEAIDGLRRMGMSVGIANSFVELSHALSEGRVHPTQADLKKPTAPTRFKQFAEEVFKPAYERAQ